MRRSSVLFFAVTTLMSSAAFAGGWALRLHDNIVIGGSYRHKTSTDLDQGSVFGL